MIIPCRNASKVGERAIRGQVQIVCSFFGTLVFIKRLMIVRAMRTWIVRVAAMAINSGRDRRTEHHRWGVQKAEHQGSGQQGAERSAVSAGAHIRQLGTDRGQNKAAKVAKV